MDSTSSVTHIGLCAGYGGIELGLQRAIPDLRTVALCEIEAFAISNLVAKMEAGLMDPAPIWPNLKTFPWSDFRDRVDILTGGYPCQPFSAAGQRKGKQDPRHLWPWIADGIRLLRPRICFFENVEGHISLGLSDVIEDLAGMGYRTTCGIFSASEVGAPHQRKRVFILAYSSTRGELARSWINSVICGKRSKQTGQLPIQQTGGESVPSERHIRHNSDDGGDGSKLAVSSSFGGASGLSGSLQRHEGQSGESDDGGGEAAWPSRPGEQQYGWEPPRVVSSECQVVRDADGTPNRMDYAQLCVSCDNRTDELRLLGNGVVPATAHRAFCTLIKELDDEEAGR